ncbi:MAG TPA: hypothetical protein ENF53_01300 [Thermoprotei archaeon]|nr:hypothetical protein [Thermoprotei archaeon]
MGDIINVLVNIARETQGIKWILVGSTASYLNGVDVRPKDIDILSDRDGAIALGRYLSAKYEVVKPMTYSTSEVYESYFGIYKIGAVKVEVMGNLVIKGRYGRFSVPFDEMLRFSREIILKGVVVRLVPLEWQLVANLYIPGKEKRVDRILDALVRNGIDIEALRYILKYCSKGVATVVNRLLKSRGVEVQLNYFM